MEHKYDENEMTEKPVDDMCDDTETEREELLYLRKKVRAYGKQLKHFEELLESNQGRRQSGAETAENNDDTIEGQLALMNRHLDELEQTISKGIYVEMMKRIDELEDKAHTDCIKVYRNVQAVVVEELSKQNKVIAKDDNMIGKIKNNMRIVLIFSIISLIASILVIIIEILPVFGINLL